MPVETTSEALMTFIREQLVDLGAEEDTIALDTRFDELDIDSLDAADLLREVTRTYGIKIPRRDLVDATIGDLVRRIVAESDGQG